MKGEGGRETGEKSKEATGEGGRGPPSTWLCLSALGRSWYHFYSPNFEV